MEHNSVPRSWHLSSVRHFLRKTCIDDIKTKPIACVRFDCSHLLRVSLGVHGGCTTRLCLPSNGHNNNNNNNNNNDMKYCCSCTAVSLRRCRGSPATICGPRKRLALDVATMVGIISPELESFGRNWSRDIVGRTFRATLKAVEARLVQK